MSDYKRWYKTSRWQKHRASFLVEHPWCVYCLQVARFSIASVVDHIVPHKGDPELFWNRSNWQSCCKECHDSIKQSFEKTGVIRPAIGLDGWPIEPRRKAQERSSDGGV